MKMNITLVILLFSAMVLSCSNSSTNNETKNTSFQKPEFNPQGEVKIVTSKKDTLLFTVEIADTPDNTAKGLMYRTKMEDNQGMYFVFEYERELSFWMKNTYMPLDIIYISSNMKIVHIAKNCMPLNEELIPSILPANFVLEIKAGISDKLNINEGDKVIFNAF